MIRFLVVSGVLTLALSIPAFAQSVQNPLYELKSSDLCAALPSPGPGNTKTLNRKDVLVLLLQAYPLPPRSSCEFDLSRSDLLKRRLAPDASDVCSGKPKLVANRTHIFADEIRFEGNETALRFRNSLLRIFEASYSGGANNLAVVRKTDAMTASTGLGTDYRPSKDSAADDAAIRRFIDGDDDFQVICTELGKPVSLQIANKPVETNQKLQTQPGKLIASLDRSSEWVQPIRSFTSGVSKQRSFGAWKGQWRLVQDRTQFTASKPKGLSIGSEFNLDLSENQSSVTINGAVGYRASFTDFKKDDWKESGTSISVIPFISIDQKPTDVATLDAENPTFSNGEQNIGKRKIAAATIFSGIRGEFEHVPAGCNSAKDTGYCGEDWMHGVRLPDRKFIATVGAFTDNYSDQQGFQIEAGYSPGFLRVLPGYRRPVRLDIESGAVRSDAGVPLGFGATFASGFMEWDTTLIADRVEFARAPRNRDTLDPSDRIENADAFRLGLDASFDIKWNNVFSIASDDAGLQFGIDYKFREGLEEGQRTLQDFTSEIKLTDVLSKNYDFGITYRVGRDILSQEKFDLIGVKAETSF